MTRAKLIFLFILTVVLCYNSDAQIILNELSNKNSGQIADEDNTFDDWIELYNPSDSAINLAGYYLSDDSLNMEKWAFPAYRMPAGKHLVVFASGKNRTIIDGGYHWGSPVLPQDTFEYIVPTASTSAKWMNPDFIPAGWNRGQAGMGYGDDDDSSVVPVGTMAVYIRKSFTLPAGFRFKDIALQVDYDDGFVAWLNGKEIARVNIAGTPTWNSPSSLTHEALMYAGGNPERFAVDTTLIKSLMVAGKNVLAIEVHNLLSTSNDLSLIPYLSFLISDTSTFFAPTPANIIRTLVRNLHTNFRINGKGEQISLFNGKTNTRESVWVKDLTSGQSLGRVTDGADTWGIFMQPTPSLANTTKAYALEWEPEPQFSVGEGYYTVKQSIRLSTASTTAEIRYTTDGSEPLATSNLYNGTPITVSATGVVRAACFSKSNKMPGRSVANTYFINNSGHTIPVLSVITANSNLYGSTGIFDNTAQEWDRPCYVEYFDANKQKKFEQFSGIQIDGGAGGSRTNAQHSFRLEFDHKSYGDGPVNYKLIPDRPDRTSYKSVYLRNGSNQWLTFQFKDAMECKLLANQTKNDYSHCTPVVVYINGAYFGVYEMREKIDDEYFEKNYDAHVDSAFQLLSLSWYYNSVLRAIIGSVDTFTSDYNRFLGLNHSDTDYLKKVDQIIDVDYYTDYIIAESWIANTDWPYNNIKMAKGDFSSNRWRFILQDVEWSLNPNGWSTSALDHIAYMLNYDQNVPYLRFWKELIKDQTYRKKFINRFADIMNSAYLPKNTTAIAQEVYSASYPEMRGEYVKWGGGESSVTTNMAQYVNSLSIFKTELTSRSTTVRANIMSDFGLTGKYTIELQVQPENAGVVQINSITPDLYPWTGTYFAGVPVRIEAKGTGNYVFDGWEPNSFIKDPQNPVVDADVKVTGYKFIAKFKLQTPEEAVTISEINYSSGVEYPAGDWVELYNYGVTAQDLTGWYITDSKADHRWIIPGNVTLAVGERLVLASNVSKFISVYPNVKNVLGSFGFGLGTPSDSVQLFNSNNKLVAGVRYSSLAPWPTGAYDKGMTLELLDPNINLNYAGNWFAGCVGGSPGVAYTTCTVTGVSESSENALARLFPNPATDDLAIILPPAMPMQELTCRIFDVMGKEVRSMMYHDVSQNRLKLSVGNLPEGIYIVHLSGENYQQSLKFIKRAE